MNGHYIHGYDHKENIRLQDQARTLVELLHSDTKYPAGCEVLEIGCGVGAQTVTLATNSPEASFTSIDLSMASILVAEEKTRSAGICNVKFQQADVFNLKFKPESFDHLFVCFVLEHLSRPVEALAKVKSLLKRGGTITVIEGDHGSAYFHPDSDAARMAIQCQVRMQKEAGGNSMIGRELYPLLKQAGFNSVRVSPRMVYVDSDKPDLVEGFTRQTFTAMVEGIRDKVVKAGMVDLDTFDKGIRDLYRTSEADGVFCYTFFKAVAEKDAGD